MLKGGQFAVVTVLGAALVLGLCLGPRSEALQDQGRYQAQYQALHHVETSQSQPGRTQPSPSQPSQGQSSQTQADQSSAPDTTVGTIRGKRLILKNGTDQMVRSYEVQGDRVRYYSIERSQWEEIPSSLVDWEATRKAETSATQKDQALLEKVRKSEAAARAAPVDIDASIEVAPKVFLPPGEGLFVVDGTAVFPLTQAAAGIKMDKKRFLESVLVPIPVVPNRRNVELPGRQAGFRLKNAAPEFYMRTADGRKPEIELIRARVHGNARQVEFVDTYITTQQTTKRQTLPLQEWDVANGVYRFTLGEKLQPGEYAIAEIIPKEGMNLYLWDFGLDSAGASASPAARAKPK